MNWIDLVLGVVALVVFGRATTARGAARQSERNARSRLGFASQNVAVIRAIAFVFVLAGIYLVASGFGLV